MPHSQIVFDSIDEKIPWLKSRLGVVSSLLYVGWRRDCHMWWHRKFCPALGIEKIGILEIFAQNASDAARAAQAGHFNSPTLRQYEIIHGDARSASAHTQKNNWDIVFWDHGPEHVSADDLPIATQQLELVAKKALLYCCPWGAWPQDASDGNVYEVHQTYIEPEHFTKLGFRVVTFGSSGKENGGEIFAYKFLGEK